MAIKVYYHGILSDIAQRTDEQYNLVSSTESLMKNFYEKYPEAKKYLFRIAVNGKMIAEEISLTDGDTIDLIPPFPGG